MARGSAFLILCAAIGSLLVALSQACSTPPGGCTIDKCNSLKGLTPPYQNKGGSTADKRIGWIYGVYNKNLQPSTTSKAGGPVVNWEVFAGIEYPYVLMNSSGLPFDSTKVNNLVDCCKLCAQTDNCWVYQFFDSKNWWEIPLIWNVGGFQYPWFAPVNFWGDRQCYLFTGGSDKSETTRGAPFSGTHTQQIDENYNNWPNKYYPPSWVGGLCNGNASVVNDPHFLGAKGTRFDFNGEVGGVFALVTDENVHINVKLDGYLDSRTTGATKVEGGKAVRTWITEIGLLWKDQAGAVHSAVFSVRRGPRMSRGPDTFLGRCVIDGVKVRAPSSPESPVTVGDLSVSLVSVEKKGYYDVETYEVSVGGRFTIRLRLRPAHPLLQTPMEAYVHFNVHIVDLQATSKVHGVLGQTFRSTIAQTVKSLEYKMLGHLLGGPVVADGASGKGFLDGEPSDYKTSGILETDSKFSSFAA